MHEAQIAALILSPRCLHCDWIYLLSSCWCLVVRILSGTICMQSIRDHRLQTEICAEMTENTRKIFSKAFEITWSWGEFYYKGAFEDSTYVGNH